MSAEPTTPTSTPELLWITHVGAVGPYLRISGQLKPMTNLSQQLESKVLPYCESIQHSWSYEQKRKALQTKECVYLVSTTNRASSLGDIEYLRTRLVRLIDTPTPQTGLFVEVDFIDMGYKKVIPCEELLITPKGHEILTMPPLASKYMMQGIFANFSTLDLENILRLIARQHLQITVEMEIEGHKFIKMKWKDWDFAEFLISQRKIGAPIDREFQQDDFMRLLKEQEQDLKLDAVNASLINNNNNNNSYKKNHNYLSNGSHSSFGVNNAKPNTAIYGNTAGARPVYGSGRVNVPTSATQFSDNKTLILKKQLLERQRQLELQNEQARQQLMQRQLIQQHIMQRVMAPQFTLPVVHNGYQNYILATGMQQSQTHRLQRPTVYTSTPVMTAPLRMQRPQMPQRAELRSENNNGVAVYAGLNGKPATIMPAVSAATTTSALTAPTEKIYKINKFTVGNSYEVCVSFVENGPCNFSVQLNASQLKLTAMMNQIERIQLKHLTSNPTVGMACIARYSEDSHMYRAVVNGVQANTIKVIYIDYGNSENVKKTDLYEIPIEFLAEPAFALPFSLAGLKVLGPIDDSLKKTFKEMVVYQMCRLKVTPPEGPPVVQYCELFMQNKNMLEVLQEIQKSRLVYPKAAHLSSNDAVEIRYIESPRNFFVQKVSNIDEFDKLMDDMDKYYNSKQVVPQHVAVGAAYAVKNDYEWYRAEVIRADEMAIIVRFIDFGYERVVTKNLVSNIAEQHLKMPRQAVHCCLKGFESNELSNKDIATTQFEMLAEESTGNRRLFTLKVFRIHPDEMHIVNLFTKELNVMKKLYKLSMPFDQYLTLEKEDFNLSASGLPNAAVAASKTKQKNENTKTYSINSSSNENSSQLGKNSIKSANAAPLLQNNQEQPKQQTLTVQQTPQQAKQQLQQVPSFPADKYQPLTHSTPAQRLQQHSNKQKKGNTSAGSGGGDWGDNNSSASSNISKHKQQQRERGGKNSMQQQQLQPYGRKSQPADLLNNSFESTDRRSDASTNSNRSRNTNAGRQKDRQHNNKDAEIFRAPAAARAKKTSSPQQQPQQPTQQRQHHQQQHQQKSMERSQNAPQGYSQSRRGSMDSQYGAIITNKNELQQMMSAKATAEAAAAALQNVKQQQQQSPPEYVPLDYVFPFEAIKTPVTEDVTICWWISPHQFYTHLKKRAAAFEELMREIQKFYHKKQSEPLKLKPDAVVVARLRKDRMFYRGRIIACNPMLRKYKVLFVDFGNQYTVSSEDIWQVERKFAEFPIMAYCCSFKNIVSNYDHLHIIDRMEKYLPNGATLSCEYKEAATTTTATQQVYFVNVKMNKASLLDRLKNDKIVTEISPDIRLELLAGQQIRAKIISIKNMLNFKIIFEGCDVPLLCSHDDVRFVKSNPDIGQRFKQFYEGKSCVINIKNVDNNKVILLRPLLPLLMEDQANLICCKPRISQTIEGRLVFIASEYRLFVHDTDAEIKVAKLLEDMYEYYESQGAPLTNFATEQICAAKSLADTNWYRARIIQTKADTSNTVEVYYFDYGNTEILERTQLKVLEPQFYVEQNALAIEINLPLMKWPSKQAAANVDVIEELRLMLEEQLLSVQNLECHNNHLIAEVSLKESGENVIDQLLAKKCIKARDFEQMCKILENDKSSMLDFIETVDLTLEDEESIGETPVNKITNSPRRKKTTQKAAEQQHQQQEEQQKPEQQIKPSTEQLNGPCKTAATPLADQQSSALELPKVAIVEESLVESKTESLPEVAADSSADTSPTATPTPQFDTTNMEQAVLSHCDNPAQFFIHTADKIEQLHKLQENLQIVASSLPPLMNAYNGANCISLYSVDKQWYRAEIIDAELMVLKFIDFGNTDCVSDTTDIKEMSVFPDIEPFCIPCALPIRPNGTADWVDAANAIFNESYEKMLYFNYITHSDHSKKPSYIQLYIDGVNIAKRLIDDGFAKPLQLVETGENCYISHVNSATDFYIQYEKDSKALELIELCLESYDNLPQLQEFLKHKIVAALFHDDEKWYRAKLLRNLGTDGYEVLFIDYGNAAVSRKCREIPAEIAELPALSKKCALDLDLNVFFGWSEAAEAKFAEISSCGDTIFNVELRAPAPEHALVHLYIDTLNVNSELEALCLRRVPPATDKTAEQCLNASFGALSVATIDPNDTTQMYTGVISHLEGPESFYVQFEKDSARLEDLTSTLNASVGMDVLRTPAEVGKLYAAVFDEDQQLYRVRVLNGNVSAEQGFEVCFVDYGNKAVVRELRILPTDLEHVRVIAKHCVLNKLDELQQMGDEAVKTFNEVVNAADGVVKLEFATAAQASNGPFKVNIYMLNNNEDILTKVKATQLKKVSFDELLKVGEPQQCLIPHYLSTQEFYVQLPQQIAKLNDITQALDKENVSAFMPKVSLVPALNQIYAVYAEDDKLYYRGLVLAKSETDSNVYTVLLIDYGNKIQVTELRELPVELKNAPAMAKLCQLANFSNDDEQPLLNEHFLTLMEAHFGESFEVEKAAVSGDKTTESAVKLKINGEDVAQKLQAALKEGAAVLLEAVPPQLSDCAIVEVNSPSSFYIQLLADTPEIEALTEALLDAETTFGEFKELQVGALCAARFPDDGNFYRSYILQVLDEEDDEGKKSCLVHFIDFGNNSVTSDFRRLPDNLLQQRRFSKHCSLDVKFKQSEEAATRHFKAYIDAHYSETFQVEFLKNDKNAEANAELIIQTVTPIPCRLFNQTKNVASEIEKKIKDETEA